MCKFGWLWSLLLDFQKLFLEYPGNLQGLLLWPLHPGSVLLAKPWGRVLRVLNHHLRCLVAGLAHNLIVVTYRTVLG